MSRALGELAWREVAACRPSPLLAVPLGSCEQHGPHLPLNTDTLIAVELAARLARAMGPRLLVAPAVTISASGEHAGFPGTLSIGAEALEQVLVELVRSADWSSGVVLVNGHGGNAEAVRAACATLRAEGRRVLDWWPRVAGGDAHAGATETSLMLAIDPVQVRLDQVEPGSAAPLEDVLDDLRRVGVRGVSANGVLGDPTAADAATGRHLLDALVADLVERVVAWASASGASEDQQGVRPPRLRGEQRRGTRTAMGFGGAAPGG